ncbi:MAG TPA: winged helix-turn-helix domain-containing protein [Gemmatimonadaceae bacterium]
MSRRKPPTSGARRTAGAPLLKRNVADLRALAHPLRLRMMELFAESPKTTKQVAELLDQPPTRLYHHVAALERAGLLVLRETRPNRGVVEKWYGAVAQQIGSPRGTSDKSSEGRAARRAVVATVMEQAKQEIMAVPLGAESALVARMIVTVPRSRIPALRKRLYDTVKAIREEVDCDESSASARKDSERWAVTLAFSPLAKPK